MVVAAGVRHAALRGSRIYIFLTDGHESSIEATLEGRLAVARHTRVGRGSVRAPVVVRLTVHDVR